ncbi:hypothetical protein FZEAL_640 [Fusarium zealandicum]|uniref:Zn(2)-C6 fungal-type domain-containing protein n=1 Tax=Fusarium zealandicum TaxID=1053134 RepID=A0A8H4XQQ4_9HYPO|nr:hypothetical protein FZEAL_640 [Fusarium zealandicum]
MDSNSDRIPKERRADESSRDKLDRLREGSSRLSFATCTRLGSIFPFLRINVINPRANAGGSSYQHLHRVDKEGSRPRSISAPQVSSKIMGRSRGGCISCKRRKRKCDETRPECQACLNRGIQCEGYAAPLRWANGIASRGRFAGASAPDLSMGTNRTAAAGPGPGAAGPASSSPPCPTPGCDGSSQSAGTSSGLSPPDSLPETQEQIFEKFLHSGFLRLYASEAYGWVHPFFEEMAKQSPALFVIAVAIQAYLDDGCRSLSVKSMERVDLALQTFRQELSDRHETMHLATLLQAQPWSKYIALMAEVYDLRTKLSCPGHIAIDDRSTRHLLEVMGIMDMPSMVIGRMSQPIGIWQLVRNLQSQSGERADGIEVVTGLARSLLDILAAILDNDADHTESRLWTWPGEVGEYLQCHLWDCWRLSGILEVRRRLRLERKQRGIPDDTYNPGRAAPSTELVLCRLVASIDALHRAFELPQNRHLLVYNGLIYPLVNASLEVPLLVNNPAWKKTLDSVQSTFLEKDTFNLATVTFELLEEAWEDGTSTFDIEGAARQRGVEIAIF